MKLIIQIPCLNEAPTLPIALAALPREVPGFDAVEILVIDDGSTDGTAEIARAHGVDHVVRHARNRGLAAAFATGIGKAIELGADVIVNTDADNQYCADDIPALVAPILEQRADVVIGARPIQKIESFSAIKKFLQRLGSLVVRRASNTDVVDAPSGFRAISRDAARRINVYNDYTYTLETIIQAGQLNLAVESVPVRVNRDLRPSRLVKSIPQYIARSLVTIVRIFVVYRPFRFFFFVGSLLLLGGLIVGLRFLYFFVTGDGQGHVQSLIFCAILLILGFHTILIAFVADLLAVNRKLLEQIKSTQDRIVTPLTRHSGGADG